MYKSLCDVFVFMFVETLISMDLEQPVYLNGKCEIITNYRLRTQMSRFAFSIYQKVTREMCSSLHITFGTRSYRNKSKRLTMNMDLNYEMHEIRLYSINKNTSTLFTGKKWVTMVTPRVVKLKVDVDSERG